MIGQAVAGHPVARRDGPRYSNRKVKCSTSRYRERDDGRPPLRPTITAIDIAVHTPPLNPSR